eukprot:5692512-Alexandrium_andersonii.AAC.1
MGDTLTSHAKSIASVVLFFSFTLKHLTDQAIEIAYKLLLWSFSALASGRHPERDWKGDAWPPQSYGAEHAGAWLGDGHRAIVVEALGGVQFIKEAWNLPYYYGETLPCYFCKASKVPGAMNFGNFLADAPSRSTRRATTESRQHFTSRAPSLNALRVR